MYFYKCSVEMKALILIFSIGLVKMCNCSRDPREDDAFVSMLKSKRSANPTKGSSDISFLIRTRMRLGWSCTGTLIHPDWVLSAAHCMDVIPDDVKINEHGDFEPLVPNLAKVFVEGYWCSSPKCNYRPGNEVTLGVSNDYDVVNFHRDVKRIILHKDSKKTALLWQGYDLALLELEKEGKWNGGSDESTVIAPACLPYKGFMKDNNIPGESMKQQKISMAGYGDRDTDMCKTSQEGVHDHNFGVCKVASQCRYRQKRFGNCYPNFEFGGEHYDKCITDIPTPQPNHKCKKLRLGNPQYSNKTIYLLENGPDEFHFKLKNICPPEYSPGGWCETLMPKSLQDRFPDVPPPAGQMWGLCDKNPNDHKTCTPVAPFPRSRDPTPMPDISVFEESHCNKELDLNLQAEQPDADWFVNKDKYTQDKVGIFCVGYNTSRKDLFESTNPSVAIHVEGRGVLDNAKDIIDRLPTDVLYHATAGPTCFGDSGGPAYFTQERGQGHVIVGVFSFLLWGTCAGTREPAYYINVEHNLDWIKQYVPSEGTCTAAKVGQGQSSFFSKLLKCFQVSNNRESFKKCLWNSGFI